MTNSAILLLTRFGEAWHRLAAELSPERLKEVPMATLARSATLGERELAEIRRSVEEAHSFFFASVTRSQVERYLNPPPNTPYGLEYAFLLSGDIRGQTILDPLIWAAVKAKT
jgi:hypothetical protein